MKPSSRLAFAAFVLCTMLAGCAMDPPLPPPDPIETAVKPTKDSVLRSIAMDRALEDRILALNPDRISEADVADTLSKAPAPHIMLLHGGVYPVHVMMESTGKFLVKMGYPESRIRNPPDGRWSYSPYEDSTHLAGLLAWYYEHEGVRPMMIGHSQGGIQAVKILYDLAGQWGKSLPVFNPYTQSVLDRTTIVDPLTGVDRPVVGVVLSLTSTVGAGGMTLFMPNQWSMLDKMYTIPDSVVEYTGYAMDLDPIGWKGTYNANGTAVVRNVQLPFGYNHLTTPYVDPLAVDKAARDWINAYNPAGPNPDPPQGSFGYGVFWAADVWWDVKKHWALEAQRLIRAKRAALGSS